MLRPRQPVPERTLPTTDAPAGSLVGSPAERFMLLVFYRGLHCPVFRADLGELQRLLPGFAQRGVAVVAASSDTAERATQDRPIGSSAHSLSRTGCRWLWRGAKPEGGGPLVMPAVTVHSAPRALAARRAGLRRRCALRPDRGGPGNLFGQCG